MTPGLNHGLSKEKYEKLYNIYHDISNPASYSGISKLYKAVKHIPNIDKTDVHTFLRDMIAHSRHGPLSKRFIRRPIRVALPGHILGADLADFSNIKTHNRGYTYVLFLIDMFSRKLDVFPIKNKKNSTVADIIDHFLKNNTKHRYSFFWSDEGKEFYGASVNKVLKTYDITQYHVYSRKIKNAIVERAIRTIKTILYRYFTQNDTLHYLDVIHQIVKTYNITSHQGLCGLTPQYVDNMTNLEEIKKHEVSQLRRKYQNYGRNIYKASNKNGISRDLDIKEGTYVRLLLTDSEKIFNKGYVPQFTEEIFKIKSVDNSSKPVVYYLEDLLQEPIEGIVYRQELKPTHLPESFPIEKVIKSKYDKKLKKKIFFVKFRSYPEKFNAWVDEVKNFGNKK